MLADQLVSIPILSTKGSSAYMLLLIQKKEVFCKMATMLIRFLFLC